MLRSLVGSEMCIRDSSSMEKFSFGEGNRASSVRIPVYTTERGAGYFEDRRPASNIDPYLVSAIIVDTCCLNGKYRQELLEQYRKFISCLLYTSPSPRDRQKSRMPSSA
eukprot:TRINITY_DN737_c0_g1_i15.p3 TRINITY_DN737_c0_g1~~TRINITY_DN737_c0_g1_i15.p3  ORF type:complete len:109 (+),score=53.54 TRINITY_DN737_c0_g1_i15:91-417(+)